MMLALFIVEAYLALIALIFAVCAAIRFVPRLFEPLDWPDIPATFDIFDPPSDLSPRDRAILDRLGRADIQTDDARHAEHWPHRDEDHSKIFI